MSEAGPSTPVRLLRWLAVGIAFFGVSSLFALLLKPLAQPRATTASASVVLPVKADAAVPTLPATSVPATAAAPRTPSPVAAPLPAGPKLAILVTELGADPALARKAIGALPPAIALAFSPDAANARQLAAEAVRAGHEAWVGLPMQPRGWPKVKPGSNTLLVADPEQKNIERTRWALSRIDAPTGAYTMMGSAFVADEKALRPVVATVRQAGLALLDARVIGGSRAAETMAAAGGRTLVNNGFIDPGSAASVDAALERLATRARANGQAVGIAGGRAGTIDRLAAFAVAAQSRGVRLVSPGRLAR